jgi:hypothetical protein
MNNGGKKTLVVMKGSALFDFRFINTRNVQDMKQQPGL